MSADAGQEVLHADDIHVLNVNAQLQENRFSKKKKKLRTVGLVLFQMFITDDT